jgi:hypothetical protein
MDLDFGKKIKANQCPSKEDTRNKLDPIEFDVFRCSISVQRKMGIVVARLVPPLES